MADIKKQLNKYGRSVYLNDGDWNSCVFRALIQPLRYKNKMYMSGVFTELGHYDEGYYLYIGPPDHNISLLSDNAVIRTSDGKAYKVHRSEKVYYKEKNIYIWAIIKEKCEVI